MDPTLGEDQSKIGNNACRSPDSEIDVDVVRQQLARLLASNLFTNSKRYPNLLKYIVEETLAGRAAFLKERILGVQVFGRDPSYDTNLDPVVRTSAAQVRQRVAQYYAEPGHETEIRIELLPGSYVPQFRHPDQTSALRPEEPRPDSFDLVPVLDAAPAAPPERLAHSGEEHRSLRWYIVAAALALLVSVLWLVFTPSAVTIAAGKFWEPVWNKSNAMVICVPGKFPTAENPTQTAGVFLPPDRDPRRPLSISESLHLNSITWPDATTLYSLIGYIQSHGQQYHVRREGNSTFLDLRTGPAVMVGGFNNEWLMRLTNRYRFTYQNDHVQGWIRDAQNPTKRDWKVVWQAPYSSFDEDYGVISRVRDPSTEHWVVVASGIASYGTISAGDFLTTPKYLAMIAQRAPKGWEEKNIQVLFATKVFNGNAGPPQILAIHVW